MKKKAVAGILIGLVVLAVGATSALAAGPGGGRHAGWSGINGGNGTGSGVCRYVDANGDGICDNYGTGCGGHYVDSNGDGICDNYGTGCGSNYVDANGDGICDNHGTGCGSNYVDSNGDGVCDNYTGSQSGHHGSGLWGGCRR